MRVLEIKSAKAAFTISLPHHRLVWSAKHLPGKHNQSAHGKGGSVETGTTARDAQAFLTKTYPHIEFDLVDIPDKRAQAVAKQFHKLSQEYPEAVATLEYVGTRPQIRGAPSLDNLSDWAYTGSTNEGPAIIALNARAFNGDKLIVRLKESVTVGWHPKGSDTVESIISHEFGHALEASIRTKSLTRNAQGQLVVDRNRYASSAHKDVVDWLMSNAGKASKISQYATTGPSEFFAEAFAAVQHFPGGEMRDDFGENLGKWLKKYRGLKFVWLRHLSGRHGRDAQREAVAIRPAGEDPERDAEVSLGAPAAVKAIDPREFSEKELLRLLEEVLESLGKRAASDILAGRDMSKKEIIKELSEALEPALIEIMAKELETISAQMEIDLPSTAANAEAAAWARKYTFDLVKGLTATTEEMLQESIAKFLEKPGMQIGELEDILKPAFGPLRAEMIATTEVTRAFSAAHQTTQEKLAESGIFMEMVWQTSEDELVCSICGPLNERPQPKWGGLGPPPAHPRCRCSTGLQVASEIKHLAGQHDQSMHGRGGKQSFPEKFEDTTPEQRMAQANYRDIKTQMDKNLQEIRREGKISHQKVAGELTSDAVEKIAENARAEIYAYTGYLAGDTTHLLHTFVNSMSSDLRRYAGEFKGTDAKDMDALVTDSVRKLVFQEVQSNRMQFTDHGIRHIVGNVAMQSRILDVLAEQGIKTTGRERILAAFVMTNHDVGYAAPLVRAGGLRGIQASGEHKEYGEKIASEQRGLWDKGKIFSEQEYDRALGWIKTHDDTKLDIKDPVGLATRVSDNLALFQAAKLPSMFQYIRGGKDMLVDLGLAAKSGDDKAWSGARQKLVDAVNSSNLGVNLKRDLISAVGEVNKFTPKFALGTLAGEISDISGRKGGGIAVKVAYNDFDSFLQNHFDLGQRATKKFLESYNQKDFTKRNYELKDEAGKIILSLDIEGAP